MMLAVRRHKRESKLPAKAGRAVRSSSFAGVGFRPVHPLFSYSLSLQHCNHDFAHAPAHHAQMCMMVQREAD